MLNHILIPLDGSDLAECVLPHAIALTKCFGSTITLLHVLETTQRPYDDPSVDPLQWELERVQAVAHLKSAKTQLRHNHVPIYTELLEGRPADCIVNFAETHRIDLILLSSHGSSGLNNWNIGSTTQKILLQARTSKLIVYAEPAMQSSKPDVSSEPLYKRVLVPLDGSWRSECVLPLATALAQCFGAELNIAHVVCRPEMARHMPLSAEDKSLIHRVEDRNREEIEHYFDELREHLTVPVKCHIIVGENVASGLRNLACQLSIDLVIVSAHGHTGETQTPYGSITGSFITYSTMPVLIFQDDSPTSLNLSYVSGTALRHSEIPLHTNL